ncbi:hypothetical protein EOM86_05610 [Candidatus Nomurabacteria bacterium]|nr:hypothetical protein [Candidatus Nomurabacteria bacterium]
MPNITPARTTAAANTIPIMIPAEGLSSGSGSPLLSGSETSSDPEDTSSELSSFDSSTLSGSPEFSVILVSSDTSDSDTSALLSGADEAKELAGAVVGVAVGAFVGLGVGVAVGAVVGVTMDSYNPSLVIETSSR